MAVTYPDVDSYIASFPPEARAVLEEVQATIRVAVPGTTEKIRYQIPAVMLGDRYLVHYAGWKRHIALYPVPVQDESLERDIAPLRSGTDTVKFMLNKPVPYELIERIVLAILQQRE
jgi:uncharacterized protein YdhG (YjbR/CyaY superfamily)